MNIDLITKIADIFRKRKYSRNRGVYDPEIVLLINDFVQQKNPIKLVGFWGIGQKKHFNWADEESCKFFNELNEEIKQVYPPGIEFTFIFATFHAIHNGYPQERIDTYVKSMITLFDKYSFKYLFLDDLWKKFEINFEKIESELASKTTDWWEHILQKDFIEKNASHRNKKYAPKLAAQRYYIMRDLEKKMFETEYKGYIFHAFTDPKLKDVLPDMPTLYFWGTKKWHSDAPWFIDSDKLPS